MLKARAVLAVESLDFSSTAYVVMNGSVVALATSLEPMDNMSWDEMAFFIDGFIEGLHAGIDSWLK